MVHLIRELTAIVFAFLLLGLGMGYLFILISPTTKSPLVFNFCLSIVLFAALLAVRALFVALYGPMHGGFAIIYNLAGIGAALLGLRAQLLLVPPDERSNWNIFTAWMYPPSGVTGRIARCLNAMASTWRRGNKK